jgi:hypothetical protein
MRNVLAYSYEQWHTRRPTQAAAKPISGFIPAVRSERPLDDRILMNGAISMYHEHDLLAEDASLLRTLGYRIYVVDASRFMTSGAFHSKIRLMLEVRRRYEETLEGFAAALRDLQPSYWGRTVIVFQHFDVFARQCRVLAKQVLDLIEAESRRGLVDGRRLIALLQSDSATLQFEPTSGVVVPWNERESPNPQTSPKSGVRVRRPVPVFVDESVHDQIA